MCWVKARREKERGHQWAVCKGNQPAVYKGFLLEVCKRGPGKGDLASEYWAQPAVWGKVKSEEIFSFVRNETKIHLGPFKLENALNLGEGKTKGLLGQLWIVGYDQG